MGVSPRAAVALYEFATALAISPELSVARDVFLARLADKVVKDMHGARKRALRVFLSRSYPLAKRLTAGYHLSLIIFLHWTDFDLTRARQALNSMRFKIWAEEVRQAAKIGNRTDDNKDIFPGENSRRASGA
jgi:hypothetical protein